MVQIPMKTSGAFSSQTITSINSSKVQMPKSANNILEVNHHTSHTNSREPQTHQPSNNSVASPEVTHLPIPVLHNKIQKGQKTALFSNASSSVDVLLGWNVKNPNCDVDVSAFLLGANGKVLGDSWFVFYGQTTSPDRSVTFHTCNRTDREMIHIDLNHIHSNVKKIVFVLTINEAFANHLNFGMIEDAYIRIMDHNQKELTSFLMTDYYSNVISMMIGEIYQHNGIWKFNAIGNGVAKDLAGLCEMYGVEVT